MPNPTNQETTSEKRGESTGRVLYIDDEPHSLELFELQFGRDYAVRTVGSGEEALAVLEAEHIAVILTDERMPGISGVDLLAQAATRWPDVSRVIVSAYSDAPRILRAINRGHAHEYVLKPWEKVDLAECIERALAAYERKRHLRTRAEAGAYFEHDLALEHDASSIVGTQGGLEDTVCAAKRAAQTNATVLITGETGSGKEMIARLIHKASARAANTFMRVNCAAIPEGTLESELFGHEKGAFTSAVAARQGRFEAAQRGTILLDEIGDVSPKLQASLLHVLQEREIERVGGGRTIAVDIRVIAATHRNLLQLARDGKFREDLYYRLNVVPIHIPPLRERSGDIPLLVQYFVKKHWARPTSPPPEVSPDALDRLCAYCWPGNVRELENIVERALIFAEGPILMPEDFSFHLNISEPSTEQGCEQEKEYFRRLLQKHGGNISRAAREANIPRSTFIHRARKYGLLP